MPRVPTASAEFPGTVRSLSDWPGLRAQTGRWLECADLYEAALRNWRVTGDGPRDLKVVDPAVAFQRHVNERDPQRVDFRSEDGYAAYQRLCDARGTMNSWRQFAPTQERQEEFIFWWLLREDPLIQAWEKLPEEIKAAFPPLELRRTTPSSVGALEELMERLRRVAAVSLRDEKALLEVLMRM